MSGLLHRLAARALDRTPPVRSDARLPFAAIAPRTDDGGDEPERPATSDDPRQPVANRSISSSPAPNPSSTARHESKPPPIETTVAAAVIPPRPVVPTPLPEQRPSAVRERARGERTPTTVPDAKGTTARPPTSVNASPTGENVATAQTEPNHRSNRSHRDQAPRRDTTGSEREPSVLVPRASPGDVPPSRRSADATAPAPIAAKDEPSEVHVHIGRIEINAVHEPAPRRRAPASPTVAPMTLDTYLAKRGRT